MTIQHPDQLNLNTKLVRNQLFEVRPLSTYLGAEIVGLTFKTLMMPEVFSRVLEAFIDHQIILFRGLELSRHHQIQIAHKFGQVQVHPLDQYLHADHPEIFYITNLDSAGNPIGRHPDPGTLFWHHDGSWLPCPGLAGMIYAEQVPAYGGETHFCDMYSAFEQLDEDLKNRLMTMEAVHNLDFSRSRRNQHDPLSDKQKANISSVNHPVIRTHPVTRRKCVFLGDHAEYIQNVEYNEGRELIEYLNKRITTNSYKYEHKWQPNDLLVWDNRCLLHRSTEYDTAIEKRVMRRVTIEGSKPF